MSVLDAAANIASFLGEQDIPYAVIGGLAVQYWGEPRTTADVDIVVIVSPERLGDFLNAAVRKFKPRLSDAVAFALENRTLLLSNAEGTPIDVSLGIPGYEEEVLRRAVMVTLPDSQSVRMVSPEDLIIHKSVAGRPRDQEDIERVLVRQKCSLDFDYIRGWLNDLRELVDDHDIVYVFERALEKAETELAEDKKG